ncbi:isocitrate lyase/phosphoenolpyruvate mutase family protein [Kiloniella sp. EL199]|uniref:isocitrate lyase/PEP mutase family protein n=1 Tax=Kiloniella sp. EL199 TaxID=2107581 RepID=UPI000EA19F37|nr:isocitrate lyase/phosphoenolpyruvate mutase family protein [Kiloniella sp. EL199]
MPSLQEKASTFHNLHKKGDPLVLYNIWDPGTAKVAAGAGAPAIATGSWSVAEAFGFPDGEKLPRDLAMENINRICNSVDVPVSLDLESGYGTTPEEVAQSVTLAGQNGAIGINFEDQIIDGQGLYSIEDQAARIAAAKKASDALDVSIFINARTDIFLKATASDDKKKLLEKVIARGQAYADSGADGFFVPALTDADLIKELCEKCLLPVNIMMMQGCPSISELADLGVARISHGPGPFRAAMAMIEKDCSALYGG